MRLGTTMAATLSLEPSSLNLTGFPVENLLPAFDNFKIAVAVCDRRLRYRAVNRALAEFTNLPVEAHPGKPMHEVLEGPIVKKAEPLLERVFSTGELLPNLRRSGRLLTRPDPVLHWLSYYFPLVDKRRRVVEVGIMVMELKSDSVSQGSAATGSVPPNQEPPRGFGRRLHSDPRDHSGFTNACRTGIILSTREQEVLRLLAEGKSNREISPILEISVKTVETYRSRLMLKIQAPSLVHLVHYAIRHKLVDLQP
jgi:DNA-binding CsgD family transcriptional regulator